MLVYDDVIPDLEAYRAAVIARPFEDVTLGVDLCFRGIQIDEEHTFPSWIRWHFPHLTPTLSFFRQSPAGQVEPNYVHTDRDMGDWTALLYLNPAPAAGDGTTFWRHRITGALGSDAADDQALLDERQAWRDLTQWEPAGQIDAKFGRAVLFPADLFHSRSIPDNYGNGDDARLVQVVFGIGRL
jgi:hypothetical protein